MRFFHTVYMMEFFTLFTGILMLQLPFNDSYRFQSACRSVGPPVGMVLFASFGTLHSSVLSKANVAGHNTSVNGLVYEMIPPFPEMGIRVNISMGILYRLGLPTWQLVKLMSRAHRLQM